MTDQYYAEHFEEEKKAIGKLSMAQIQQRIWDGMYELDQLQLELDLVTEPADEDRLKMEIKKARKKIDLLNYFLHGDSLTADNNAVLSSPTDLVNIDAQIDEAILDDINL